MMHMLCFFGLMMVPMHSMRQAEPKLVLKGLDPIALSEGKEIPGLESLETVHGVFRYRFANPENKKAFDAQPDERSVQFSGACGRMGPFSGMGHPERFAVYNRRIYLFASEACRSSFKKDPEKHIERPNHPPSGSEADRKHGEKLVKLVLQGFGGSEKVDALKTMQITTRHTYKGASSDSISSLQLLWAFPNKVKMVEVFSSSYGYVVDGAKGFQISGKEFWPMDESLRDTAWRQMLRFPLAMLKNRLSKDFLAVARGKGKIDNTEVELLDVALDGATSTWTIDPNSGRILQSQFEARRWTVGVNIIRYSDFRTVEGLSLPYHQVLHFDGKEVKSPIAQIERISVNLKLPPETFLPIQVGVEVFR